MGWKDNERHQNFVNDLAAVFVKHGITLKENENYCESEDGGDQFDGLSYTLWGEDFYLEFDTLFDELEKRGIAKA